MSELEKSLADSIRRYTHKSRAVTPDDTRVFNEIAKRWAASDATEIEGLRKSSKRREKRKRADEESSRIAKIKKEQEEAAEEAQREHDSLQEMVRIVYPNAPEISIKLSTEGEWITWDNHYISDRCTYCREDAVDTEEFHSGDYPDPHYKEEFEIVLTKSGRTFYKHGIEPEIFQAYEYDDSCVVIEQLSDDFISVDAYCDASVEYTATETSDERRKELLDFIMCVYEHAHSEHCQGVRGLVRKSMEDFLSENPRESYREMDGLDYIAMPADWVSIRTDQQCTECATFSDISSE